MKNTLRQGRPLKGPRAGKDTYIPALNMDVCVEEQMHFQTTGGKVDGYNLLESKYTCPLLPSPAKGLHETRDHKIATCFIYLSWKWHTT